jgi:hypothetical protein
MTPTDKCRERGVSNLFKNKRNQTHTKTSPPRQNKAREFRLEYFVRIALSAVVQLQERSLTNSGWLRKYFIKYKSPPILDELIGAISNIFSMVYERRVLIRSA